MAMGMSSKFGKMDASKNSYDKPSRRVSNPRRVNANVTNPPAGQGLSMRQARMKAMKKRVAGK
jgi:hypothetical protein